MSYSTVTVNGKPVKINSKLNAHVGQVRKHIRRDNDYLCLAIGKEGTGKTTFSSLMAYVLYPKLSLDDYVFSAREFLYAMRDKYNSCIMYDEAITGSSNKQVMKKENVLIGKMLMATRDHNNLIFMCVPYLAETSKFYSRLRSHNIVLLKRDAKGQRGSFYFWKEKRKEKDFLKFKTLKRPSFSGKFNKFFPFPWGEYKERKKVVCESIIGELEKEGSKRDRKFKEYTRSLAEYVMDSEKLTQVQMAHKLTAISGETMTQSSLSRLLGGV